jgi:hypothetical protein
MGLLSRCWSNSRNLVTNHDTLVSTITGHDGSFIGGFGIPHKVESTSVTTKVKYIGFTEGATCWTRNLGKEKVGSVWLFMTPWVYEDSSISCPVVVLIDSLDDCVERESYRMEHDQPSTTKWPSFIPNLLTKQPAIEALPSRHQTSVSTSNCNISHAIDWRCCSDPRQKIDMGDRS